MSLTSLKRVKHILGIPVGVTFYDESLGYAVDHANSHVLRVIRQPNGLAATTRTEYPAVYGPGQREVVLKHTPIDTVISITNGSGTLGSDDYRIDADAGRVYLTGQASYWSDVPDSVVIQHLAGYTEATVPDELRRAADLIAVHTAEQGRHAGKDSSRQGSYSLTVSKAEIPPTAARILAAYQDAFHP